ncbi:prephenate dehydrogenase [Ligilactobacillus sp. WILCCON 0076]|uniref:Prephenate dehydrogenase n=1 Tax=Ligilactobacillus ubinensis TaxID=2876789 RepID=A0A9X2FLC9_9LACO|nr:prephenate dehydrogenase [Ligilactobacillus ubinensis]MCP0886473.1 prephenate dehydrogenase [Ligilactobacillus ubinensis]
MADIFIRGLGLIGSSLVRAIKQKNEKLTICASDSNLSNLDYAKKRHLIDETCDDLQKATQADIIILATPITQIIEDIKSLARLPLKPGVIITDVGSTKQTVIQTAELLTEQGISFVGGHPMAGSHKTGVQAGRADLFENAFYFQITTENNEEAVVKIRDLLSETKAKWLRVTAKQHDKIVAQLSHVPHVIASALVNQTSEAFKDEPLGMRLAAGGFKSITRIASADPEMWTAILLNNTNLITKQLNEYIEALQDIVVKTKDKDVLALQTFFAQAKVKRDSLGPEKVGAVPNFYDLFINIPDQTGSLAKVTALLTTAEINIVNIHILEIREEVDGILQLTFSSDKDYKKAKATLLPYFQVINRDN